MYKIFQKPYHHGAKCISLSYLQILFQTFSGVVIKEIQNSVISISCANDVCATRPVRYEILPRTHLKKKYVLGLLCLVT